jgi:hypothetical protein
MFVNWVYERRGEEAEEEDTASRRGERRWK